MKYIITEEQYRVISEQNMSGWSQGLTSKQTSDAVEGWNDAYSNHTLLTILQIGSAFIPLIGPFLSAGIGLADAGVYHKNGDTKTAGLIGLFSIIPGIGGLSAKLGIGTISSKIMAQIGKKISLGSKLTSEEAKVVSKIAKNRALIESEIKKLGTEVGVTVAKQNVKSQIKKTAIKNIPKKIGKQLFPYVAAGYAYSKGYDRIQKNTPKEIVKNEGFDWDFVKKSFGSSGEEQDNKLLTQAWQKGWRPGQTVPQEFQTKQYKILYNQTNKNLNTLNALIAQANIE
jgi:hypothetical protein